MCRSVLLNVRVRACVHAGAEDGECVRVSLCVRGRHKNGDKDKGRGGRGASAARPCEPPSATASPALELADFSLRALHIIWVGSGVEVGFRGSTVNLTRLICLPHLSGFYFLLLAGPLSNLFGQAHAHMTPEGELKDVRRGVTEISSSGSGYLARSD